MLAFALGTVTATSVCAVSPIKSAQTQTETVDKFERSVPPLGTTDKTVLSKAPSPKVTICGEKKNARIVVDAANNILYKYDDNGKAEKAYSVATGKNSTPTLTGTYRVSHVEVSPYKYAPSWTVRRKNPRAFGKHAVILDIIDLKTGEISSTGQFIHGNNDESSVGFRRSGGCMRMANKAMDDEISKQVKRGDIVLIINPYGEIKPKRKK